MNDHYGKKLIKCRLCSFETVIEYEYKTHIEKEYHNSDQNKNSLYSSKVMIIITESTNIIIHIRSGKKCTNIQNENKSIIRSDQNDNYVECKSNTSLSTLSLSRLTTVAIIPTSQF